MAVKEYIDKWEVVKQLLELESEVLRYSPFQRFEYDMYRKICEALIAINNLPIGKVVSAGVFDQVRWERDTAMMQLEEHGIPFGGIAPKKVKTNAPDTNVGHIDAARMNEIMQAEREGRLVILPCDFGADLWWIDDEKNEVRCEKGDVKGFVVLKDGVRILDQSDEWGRIGTQYYHLSRESAEKALEDEE